jgi:hypothetical protein
MKKVSLFDPVVHNTQKVEPYQVGFAFDLPAGVRRSPTDFMQPGESRVFRGRVDYPIRPIAGVCATTGMREAVTYTFDERWHSPGKQRWIIVTVTLNKKAAPAVVRPALMIVGSNDLPEKDPIAHDIHTEYGGRARLLEPRSYRHEWRSLLPLECLEPISLSKPESLCVSIVQPPVVFRGKSLLFDTNRIHNSGVDIEVMELRAANIAMWYGEKVGIPIGIFNPSDGYDVPELDMPTLNPAQRFVMELGSRTNGATKILASLVGVGLVES